MRKTQADDRGYPPDRGAVRISFSRRDYTIGKSRGQLGIYRIEEGLLSLVKVRGDDVNFLGVRSPGGPAGSDVPACGLAGLIGTKYAGYYEESAWRRA
jgi:hypothetical protein